MNTDSTPDSKSAQYGDYLHVNELLALQQPLSAPALSEAPAAHDEMLFIIDHQAYELWFKQVLFETKSCIAMLSKPIDDNGPEMQLLVNRLRRVVMIWKVLHLQVDVLETMTPMDFLEFRHLFTGASGFQSAQFRHIETLMGLKPENRHGGDYYKKTKEGCMKPDDVTVLTKLEGEANLRILVTAWLSRTPALKDEANWKDFSTKADSPFTQHPFWREYRARYESSLSKTDKKDERMAEFDHVLLTCGSGGFSAEALRAALFIMLYRDLPLFQLPHELLRTLIEIDEHMGEWRHRHLQMVRRMIGLRTGTGGSSGAGYLEGTLAKGYVFGPLNELTTFMIRRTSMPGCQDGLPEVPLALRKSLGFNNQL